MSTATESRAPGVVPLRSVPPEDVGTGRLLERAAGIAIGLASLAAVAIGELVARSMSDGTDAAPVGSAPTEDETGAAAKAAGTWLGLIAGAALGLAVEGARMAARASAVAAGAAAPLRSAVMSSGAAREQLARLEAALRSLDERWRSRRERAEDAAAAFADELVPEIARAIIERIDVDELVAARVDADRIVDSMDLDRIVDRIDIGRIVERVDVDAVAARIDLDALVERLDLVGIARHVIEELDLEEIIRGSTETIASETVEGIRVQGIHADRFVARLVDRVLMRGDARDGATGDEL